MSRRIFVDLTLLHHPGIRGRLIYPEGSDGCRVQVCALLLPPPPFSPPETCPHAASVSAWTTWLFEATIVAMKIVGIRELKDRLSEYLRHVRRKGPIYISNRGEIVAELRESYGTAAHVGPDVPAGLRELAEEGLLTLGGPNDPSCYPVLDPIAPEGTAARLIDEDRG